jgi:hypothetical protein
MKRRKRNDDDSRGDRRIVENTKVLKFMCHEGLRSNILVGLFAHLVTEYCQKVSK